MDHRQLANFIALAEALNFTRAAARQNISQPPFSRSIAALERDLGVRLFDRDRHSVRLTDAGLAMLGDARRIVDLTQEAVERAKQTARGLRGTLTLGFGGSSTYAYLPRVVRAFGDAVPDVRVVFRSMPVLDQVEALRVGTIDLGLLRLPVTEELISTQLAYSEPLVVAIPTSHPLLGREGRISMGELTTCAFVTYEPRRGFNYHADLHALCRLAGFEPAIAHEAHSTDAVVGIVACGQGVALVPKSAERLRMRGVEFRPLDLDSVPPALARVNFGLAWRTAAPSPIIPEFLAHALAIDAD